MWTKEKKEFVIGWRDFLKRTNPELAFTEMADIIFKYHPLQQDLEVMNASDANDGSKGKRGKEKKKLSAKVVLTLLYNLGREPPPVTPFPPFLLL